MPFFLDNSVGTIAGVIGNFNEMRVAYAVDHGQSWLLRGDELYDKIMRCGVADYYTVGQKMPSELVEQRQDFGGRKGGLYNFCRMIG